ncbi:hypothetical protein F0562_008101 [Nyssa sinensis]|uniref:Uncharacterized protein n=1 Tax=Nyssa sinensis TaxID=561372 RepID=A0A5J5AA66_9ASTE|nr:hypothetical protein F0562_008101 [Nyssa sinensis]
MTAAAATEPQDMRAIAQPFIFLRVPDMETPLSFLPLVHSRGQSESLCVLGFIFIFVFIVELCGLFVFCSDVFIGEERKWACFCSLKDANIKPLTGVVFEPFEDVTKELFLIPNVPHASFACQKFSDEFEASINEQIKWVSISLL